jgi:hypothetical protein
MPGWPVEVWVNDKNGVPKRLSETNVKHDILNDKDRWCRFLDDLITTNYIHNRKTLRR